MRAASVVLLGEYTLGAFPRIVALALAPWLMPLRGAPRTIPGPLLLPTLQGVG